MADAIVLVGDQVYADKVSPMTEAFIRDRRDNEQAPGEEIADFEEYTRLYREASSNPDIRWLLSTVPTTMIFDDHDVHDDWNISEAWVAEMHEKPWWEARITGAFMAYWLYQHLGNLSPTEIVDDALLDEIRGEADGGPRLRERARTWIATGSQAGGRTSATLDGHACLSSIAAQDASSQRTDAR